MFRRLITLLTVGCMMAVVAALATSHHQTKDAAEVFAAADEPAPATADGIVPADSDVAVQADEALLDPLPETEAEWRKVLTRPQYRVLRLKETERPFSGKYAKSRTAGVYRCAGCGQPVFSSAHKFDSGTGWPSYWQPYARENIALRPDNTLFVRRVEVVCGRCEGHLGHVFSDGPPPTGLRFCINSVALKLDDAPQQRQPAAPEPIASD